MTIIKPLSAFLIVLLGQGNFLAQNYKNSAEKLKQLYQKTTEKNSSEIEEVKDHKKSSSSAKQRVSRLNHGLRLSFFRKKSGFIPKNSFPLLKQEKSKLNFLYLFGIAFNMKQKERLMSDYNSIKPVWFGCCGVAKPQALITTFFFLPLIAFLYQSLQSQQI